MNVKKYSRLPSPKGTLIGGQLADFRRAPLEFLTGLADRDMARFRLGPFRCLLINSPDLIHECMVKDGSTLEKSWDYKELRVALGEGLVTSEGDLWRRQRRLIQPAFSSDRLRDYGRIMVQRTERLLEGWRSDTSRNISEDMMQLTLEIVAESLFGVEVEDIVEPITQTLTQTMDRFEEMMTSALPLPMSIPTPANLRLKRTIRQFDKAVVDIIHKRRASGRASEDLLGILLSLRDSDGSRLTDKQLRDELVTLLLAGHETTALALSWTFALLGRSPQVHQKLLEELDEVLGDRAPGVDDLPSLSYTRAVIDESMRLYPPVWGIGRQAARAFELGGYTIPKGTQIFAAQWVTHRSAKYFDDPLRFDPERWRSPTHPKRAYFPFGVGPRKCVGMHFAMMEAILVLATIARRYEVQVSQDQSLEAQPAVTLRPRSDVQARVLCRTPQATHAAQVVA